MITNLDIDVSNIHNMPAILREMRLSTMADVLEAQLNDPNSVLDSHEDKLIALIMAEYNERVNNKIMRQIKAAKLKMPGADLTDLQPREDRELDLLVVEKLKDCVWIDNRHNLIITGPCGCGKTWIGCALGANACEKFYKVKFHSTSKLITQLKICDEKEYLSALDKISKLDLLILDDVGLMTYDLESCRIFFEVLDARYQNGSTIFISQFPVKTWYELFADKTYADAVLSRAIEKAIRLPIFSPDLRKEQ